MKKRLLADANAELKILESTEEIRKKFAMQEALKDKSFNKTIKDFGELIATFVDPKKNLLPEIDEIKALDLAIKKRDTHFAHFYKPKSMPTVEALLAKKVRELNPNLINFSETFDDSTLHKKMTKYCKEFPKTEKLNMVFMGGTGTGKTHTASIIANDLIEHGFIVLYVTAFNLIKRFRDYVFERDEDALHDLLECDLLVIDDLGTEPIIPNVSAENLYTVVNERLVNFRPMIISTNLSVNELSNRYDQRLTSRIMSPQTTKIIDFGKVDLRFPSTAKKPNV